MHDLKKQPKFYMLLAHGLNLNPDKMKSFYPLIESLGGVADLVEFAGHTKGKLREYNQVSKDQWVHNIDDKFQNYLKNYRGVPLYFLGFSLGAVAGLSYLQQNLEFQNYLKKQIFLAPGIEPHSIYEKIYRSMGFPNILVPSLNRFEYKIHKINSLRVNNEIFKLIDDVKSKNLELINIPTLVFLNPRDELISLKKTIKFIKKSNLSNWKVSKLTPKRKLWPPMFHHLIVDEMSVGGEWQKMQNEISEFIASSAHPQYEKVQVCDP